jgi:calcineurin-like phosphoesterase family protein
MSRYAHRVWPSMHRGDLHFYGHSHGTLPGTAASTDVGVDCFGFRPVTLDDRLCRDRHTRPVRRPTGARAQQLGPGKAGA